MRFIRIIQLILASQALAQAPAWLEPLQAKFDSKLLETLNVTVGYREVPGIIKDDAKISAAKLGLGGTHFGNTGVAQGGSMPNNKRRDLVAEALEVRQQCPPTHPVPCPGNRCCQAAYPNCCSSGNCCEAGYPNCCSGGGCCPNTFPVCSQNICCASGMTGCGTVDPLICKPAIGARCCGLGLVCITGTACCGTKCCLSDQGYKCCPWTDPTKAVCCEERQVCCDGYCCPEGSTCTPGRPGYCTVPTLTFGYVQGGIAMDLVENMCLGFRAQAAMGRPNVATNGQIVTYYGKGADQRKFNDCNPNRNPPCCRGRTVPASEPGAGDPMSCEEYPFNSAIEGGVGATCSCVNDYANKGAGDMIGAMVRGHERGFMYLVEVVGIDCATVTPADIWPCNPLGSTPPNPSSSSTPSSPSSTP